MPTLRAIAALLCMLVSLAPSSRPARADELKEQRARLEEAQRNKIDHVCRKIRLAPNDEVAGAASTEGSSPPASLTSRSREATLADIDRIESLTLDDYAVDVSQFSLPLDGGTSEADLQAAAERFIQSMRGS